MVAVRAQLESPHTELAARPVVDEPAVIASSPAPEPVQIAAATPPASAVPAETPAPASGRRRFKGLPPGSPLEQIEFGMRHFEVLEILGQPAEKTRRSTRKAWIPFYTGPGAHLVDWRYDAIGTVIFSLHHGRLEVVDLVAVAP